MKLEENPFCLLDENLKPLTEKNLEKIIETQRPIEISGNFGEYSNGLIKLTSAYYSKKNNNGIYSHFKLVDYYVSEMIYKKKEPNKMYSQTTIKIKEKKLRERKVMFPKRTDL